MRESIKDQALRIRQTIGNVDFTNSLEQASNLPPSLFDPWEPGKDYDVGILCEWNGELYKCIQAHTSQAGQEPDKMPELWLRTDKPLPEDFPLIPNPIPSTAPWMKGQRGKTADGRKWESAIDNNVWQPSVYPQGWKEIL